MCRQLRGLVSERWLRVGAAALCPAPPPPPLLHIPGGLEEVLGWLRGRVRP